MTWLGRLRIRVPSALRTSVATVKPYLWAPADISVAVSALAMAKRTAADDVAGPGTAALDLGTNNALHITTVDTGLVLTVSGGAIGDDATITVSAGAGALTLPGVTLLTNGAIPVGAVDVIVWKNAAGNLVATWGTST